ncbi:hypothetical protein FRB93_002939 [Tulasnella sp. JGI-2019a]|nr:hypothetical protein FRB93_002939 [Tulasnella sp. JGI-2019a]
MLGLLPNVSILDKFETLKSGCSPISMLTAAGTYNTSGTPIGRAGVGQNSQVPAMRNEAERTEIARMPLPKPERENLPEELWHEIISIADPPPNSLVSLCRVSRLFAIVCTPFLYRDACTIVNASRSNTRGARLIRTIEENPKFASLIQIYRGLPGNPVLSATVLGAMTNIKSAFLSLRAFDFIQHCPSRKIEVVSIDSSLWPPRRYISGGERETRLVQWLVDQSNMQHLELRKENGWLDELSLPAEALSRLKTLTCDAAIAEVILPGRSVERYSITPTRPKSLGLPTPQEVLEARQLLETSVPPSLIAAFSISIRELKLGMRGDEIIAKLQLLSEHAPKISHLVIETPKPPNFTICLSIAHALTTFTALESFILNFTDVRWNDVMSYPVGCTSRLFDDWIQACPSLRTVRINERVDDTWFTDAMKMHKPRVVCCF